MSLDDAGFTAAYCNILRRHSLRQFEGKVFISRFPISKTVHSI